MELKIKKVYLKKVADFLNQLKLTGKLSRARIKIMKLIDEALTDMQEDMSHIQDETNVSAELRHEYRDATSSGRKLIDAEIEKFDKLIKENKEITELLNEDAIMDATKHKRLINELYIHLENLDIELDGNDGYVHDLLLDAIEDNHTDVTDQFQEVE